ncbi:MAG: DNA-directed RNA polymerase subunit omega [Epulopiscium sp. Nele67-Bin005]|nr:MAG: DNA-directed RNA polymerase subunit omega [Epulopiscium sp. Nele67-Bin005]
MLEPSYSQITEKINTEAQETVITSRYSIIIATARRARQIIDIVNGEMNDKDYDGWTDPIRSKQATELAIKLRKKKPTSIAVDELYKGKIKIREQDLD